MNDTHMAQIDAFAFACSASRLEVRKSDDAMPLELPCWCVVFLLHWFVATTTGCWFVRVISIRVVLVVVLAIVVDEVMVMTFSTLLRFLVEFELNYLELN